MIERKDQVELLFQLAAQMGLNTSYHAIAAATGESAPNIRRIRLGEITNPGVNTLETLGKYFGVGLEYFACQSAEECEAYVKGVAKERVSSAIAQRTAGISEEGLQTILQMINHVRRLEGLSEIALEDLDDLGKSGKS